MNERISCDACGEGVRAVTLFVKTTDENSIIALCGHHANKNEEALAVKEFARKPLPTS